MSLTFLLSVILASLTLELVLHGDGEKHGSCMANLELRDTQHIFHLGILQQGKWTCGSGHKDVLGSYCSFLDALIILSALADSSEIHFKENDADKKTRE